MSLNFLTPSDLEQAMKKQLEDVQAELEKSQAKLLDKMKKALKVELRRVNEGSPRPMPLNFEEVKSDEKKDGRGRHDRKLATLNKFTISPVNLNARLNEGDDAPKVNNMRRTMARFQAATAVETFAHSSTLPEKESNPVSPRTPRTERTSFSQDPGHTVAGEGETFESTAKRVSVRALSRQRQEEEVKGIRESTVESQESVALGSNHSNHGFEPLLETDGGVEQRGQKIDWLACLQSPFLEGTIVGIVILNALWVGFALEYKLTISEIRPIYFDWIDILFCILFSFELLLRISVFQLDFFDINGPHWTWNYFDLLLVLCQIMEIVLRFLDRSKIVHKNVNVSYLQVLRILRIVRLTRIVRAVRFIQGLRTLIKHVFRGVTATAWISLFLVMQIYTCSLAFTELLHEIRTEHTSNLTESDEFESLFGSLLNTMGTLFKSITCGITWGTALDVFMGLSPLLGFCFVIHVAFNLFVILNVITGFFIKTSSMCADEDSKAIVRDRVAEIFGLDDEKDQCMDTVDEAFFTDRLNSPEMQAYLNQIDLHVDEAEGLFQLLDLNGNGTLDPLELVSGLMRIRGSAKALDVRILMYMVTKAQEMNHEHLRALEEKIVRALQLQDDNGAGEADGI